MQADDETTAIELKRKLDANGINLSLSTILRCRRNLGWTYRGSAYCQLIREPNKLKLSWCLENQNNDFSNVVWTDETSVQLESHRRFCHRKHGQKPHPKPRYVMVTTGMHTFLWCFRHTFFGLPKHPVKVHLWGGISKRGAHI
jgi:hypothetical protein